MNSRDRFLFVGPGPQGKFFTIALLGGRWHLTCLLSWCWLKGIYWRRGWVSVGRQAGTVLLRVGPVIVSGRLP